MAKVKLAERNGEEEGEKGGWREGVEGPLGGKKEGKRRRGGGREEKRLICTY